MIETKDQQVCAIYRTETDAWGKTLSICATFHALQDFP